MLALLSWLYYLFTHHESCTSNLCYRTCSQRYMKIFLLLVCYHQWDYHDTFYCEADGITKLVTWIWFWIFNINSILICIPTDSNVDMEDKLVKNIHTKLGPPHTSAEDTVLSRGDYCYWHYRCDGFDDVVSINKSCDNNPLSYFCISKFTSVTESYQRYILHKYRMAC